MKSGRNRKSKGYTGVQWMFLKESHPFPVTTNLKSKTSLDNTSVQNTKNLETRNTKTLEDITTSMPSDMISYITMGKEDTLVAEIIKSSTKESSELDDSQSIFSSEMNSEIEDEDEDEDEDEEEDIEEEHENRLNKVVSDKREEDNFGRSPSPVIVWRPSCRIKIATDIPPELLEDSDDSIEEIIEDRWQDAYPLFSQKSSSIKPEGATQKRQRYGVWHLPVELWKDMPEMDRKAEQAKNSRSEFRLGAKRAKELDLLDQRCADVKEKLEKLPISAKFKQVNIFN